VPLRHGGGGALQRQVVQGRPRVLQVTKMYKKKYSVKGHDNEILGPPRKQSFSNLSSIGWGFSSFYRCLWYVVATPFIVHDTLQVTNSTQKSILKF
jgi:hypothetical protein